MSKKKKIKKSQNNKLEEIIYNEGAEEWCIKSNIATSYTFNFDDPSMPYCKAHQNCKYKIDNYGERPCCLYMHNKYEGEIKND